MKKIVIATVLALASISLVTAPMLRAQDITIKDPAEFNAYQMASSQPDLKTKASQLESFLQTYPQSVVKNSILELLIQTYQGVGNNEKTLDAANRLLQVDPNNLKAVFISVYVKKSQCAKTSDAQTCDDGAAMAKKGLLLSKPASTTDADWKSLVDLAYPVFHSAMALDYAVSKKDLKAAIAEYKAELMLYTDEQSKTTGLPDTLQLAQLYVQPETKDLVQAVWFYARVWNFAPPAFKAKIEPELERYYKKFHGALDGLDALKTQAAATTFPPGTLVIAPAKSPADMIHELLASTPDLNKLALADKETVLAVGSKEDADKLWALLKDQQTPVPGVVIEATASVIKVAVTQDAKDAKIADFIVNLKTPLVEKDIPAVGFEYKLQPGTELDGTYDSYTAIPATDTTTQSAQIVLKDAFIQLEKKKTAAPVRAKPAAGKKPAAKAK
jgi:hypothetical protein